MKVSKEITSEFIKAETERFLKNKGKIKILKPQYTGSFDFDTIDDILENPPQQIIDE